MWDSVVVGSGSNEHVVEQLDLIADQLVYAVQPGCPGLGEHLVDKGLERCVVVDAGDVATNLGLGFQSRSIRFKFGEYVGRYTACILETLTY